MNPITLNNHKKYLNRSIPLKLTENIKFWLNLINNAREKTIALHDLSTFNIVIVM